MSELTLNLQLGRGFVNLNFQNPVKNKIFIKNRQKYSGKLVKNMAAKRIDFSFFYLYNEK